MTRINQLDSYEIAQLHQQCAPDKDGWAQTKELVQKIQTKLGCSMPTAYSVVNRFSGLFEKRHGKLRLLALPCPVESFAATVEKNSKVLDRAVEFVSGKLQGVQLQDYMVLIGSVREELKSGVEGGFDNLFIRMEQEFGVTRKDFEEEKKSEIQAVNR